MDGQLQFAEFVVVATNEFADVAVEQTGQSTGVVVEQTGQFVGVVVGQFICACVGDVVGTVKSRVQASFL